ncbi:MAG TPA: NAD(P)-dependent oxidoreductase [Burkholderiales bacterium]|jgi:hypothetical protein
MNIAIIGATGSVGGRLTQEALSRGHQVTAIARKANELPAQAGLTPVAISYTDNAALTTAIRDKDAVLLAVKFTSGDGPQILRAVKAAHPGRLLAVGGAGSLEAKPGLDVVDTPDFPAAYKDEALAAREFLRSLRRENELDWTMISPSALLAPGERTGKYRVGTDQLLVDAQGKSHISIEDLAKALIDELEQPKFRRARFTVGY